MGAVVTAITTTGDGTWACPHNVFQVYVECRGGGAGGGGGSGVGTGGGGGGGEYRAGYINVQPGTTYDYHVGIGGTSVVGGSNGNDGEDTWFVDTGTLLAKKGVKGLFANPNGSGGAGGTGGTGGTVNFDGGTGGTGVAAASGGGGGGAGTTAVGGNGGVASAGTGGSAGGGNGGIGSNGGDGTAGNTIGGGGGGGGKSAGRTGAAGARGELQITYTPLPRHPDVFTFDPGMI